ncbi:hypothetical protein EIP86_001978 [Pleurotus ostreatoroseus]|nr:hypothetical protein EIP86_001978 [Pleurotus ostreatoroseus]
MALVAVPSHRIHSAFGGPSFASISGASASAAHIQASWNAQPNVSYRSRAAPLSILAARTSAASSSYNHAPSTPVVTRPRRPSFRSVTIPSAPVDTRRAPPSTRTQAQDPFADSSEYVHPTRAARTAAPSQKTIILTYSTYSYPTVSTPRVQPVDANRTSRLVASVLLNRTNGKPLRARRAPPCASGEERVYVPSCLSKMVEVEC